MVGGVFTLQAVLCPCLCCYVGPSFVCREVSLAPLQRYSLYQNSWILAVAASLARVERFPPTSKCKQFSRKKKKKKRPYQYHFDSSPSCTMLKQWSFPICVQTTCFKTCTPTFLVPFTCSVVKYFFKICHVIYFNE